VKTLRPQKELWPFATTYRHTIVAIPPAFVSGSRIFSGPISCLQFNMAYIDLYSRKGNFEVDF